MERTELSGRSTTELVRRATEQMTTLVRSELQLAKAELAEKGKRAGTGVGLFGGAGVVALYGLGVLIAAGVLALALVLPAWAAALIVAGLLFVIAAVLVLVGRASLRKGLPPVPEQTVASVRADIDAVSTAVAERGQGHEPILNDAYPSAAHPNGIAPYGSGSTNGTRS
jgi:uncharacterized membrane protein YqjE